MGKHIVTPTAEESEMRQNMIRSGTGRARKLTHDRTLLKADEHWRDKANSKALNVGIATVERAWNHFVLEGVEAALGRRRAKRFYSPKFDGEQDARLVAVACSQPPEGRGRWSLRLLAHRVVQLAIVGCASHEAVRQVLKRTKLKPWLREEWLSPAKSFDQVRPISGQNG